MTPDRIQPLESDSVQRSEWITYRERGSRWLLALMVFLSLRLGRTATRSVLYGIALYFFAFAPSARRCSRRYLELALGRKARAVDRFRQIFYFATCIHDRVYLMKEQYQRFQLTIEGEELLRAQHEAARGALLMGAHLGSFEVVSGIGRRRPGLSVSMAMYEDNARRVNAMITAIDAGSKADIIPLGQIDTMLRIAEHLDRGAFVGLLADRTLGDAHLQEVTLLGRRTLLPTGPMRAAAILRCPVIFMAGLHRGGNRYHLVFAPIADFSKTPRGERSAAVASAVERYACLLERYCRSDPYNWFNFYDFWRERDSAA